MPLAQSLRQAAPTVLGELLERENWGDLLSPAIRQCLMEPGETPVSHSLECSPEPILAHLDALLQEQNPMVQAASLYVMAQLDIKRGQEIARTVGRGSIPNSFKKPSIGYCPWTRHQPPIHP